MSYYRRDPITDSVGKMFCRSKFLLWVEAIKHRRKLGHSEYAQKVIFDLRCVEGTGVIGCAFQYRRGG